MQAILLDSSVTKPLLRRKLESSDRSKQGGFQSRSAQRDRERLVEERLPKWVALNLLAVPVT